MSPMSPKAETLTQDTGPRSSCHMVVPHNLPMAKGACAHDRRVLQQLALNVHVKHSDLT